MADIDEVHVVNWANGRSRVIADQMTSLLDRLLSYQTDYTAQGIGSLISDAGNTNLIADGSDLDGRQRVTGLQIQNLKAAIDQLVTAWNVTAVSGVGATVASIQNGIQVNGSIR